MLKIADVKRTRANIEVKEKNYLMADLVLHLTIEQRQRIEALAHQRGHETLDAYLLALVELDAQSAPVLQDGKEDLPSDSFEATFRKALHDVMSNSTQPDDHLYPTFDDE